MSEGGGAADSARIQAAGAGYFRRHAAALAALTGGEGWSASAHRGMVRLAVPRRSDRRFSMPLLFHPAPGTIVMCDFGTGFIVPEMVKVRPVVVVSPRFRTRPKLCTVVPLSSTEPRPLEPYHHRLSAGAYPPARGPMWAKCDMLATVSIDRLDRIKTRGRGGKRSYVTFAMPPDDMAAVMACVRVALGFVD